MRKVPKLTAADVAFGNIDHLPKWETIPADFQRGSSNHPWTSLVDHWFFEGAGLHDGKLRIGNVVLHPKDGVDQSAALAAIRACIGSWAPKHEHKVAGVGLLLSEWFDHEVVDAKAA